MMSSQLQHLFGENQVAPFPSLSKYQDEMGQPKTDNKEKKWVHKILSSKNGVYHFAKLRSKIPKTHVYDQPKLTFHTFKQ